MKILWLFSVTVLTVAAGAANVPKDLSKVRGANYRATAAKDTTDYWLHYSPAETERDLDYARRLNLNQLRVFLSYEAWTADKPAFRRNLTHLMRAARQRGLGVMPVVGNTELMIMDDSARPLAREWAADLVHTIGKEPALAFWDVSNEPDWPPRRRRGCTGGLTSPAIWPACSMSWIRTRLSHADSPLFRAWRNWRMRWTFFRSTTTCRTGR